MSAANTAGTLRALAPWILASGTALSAASACDHNDSGETITVPHSTGLAGARTPDDTPALEGPQAPTWKFLGEDESIVRQALLTEPIEHVERGRGGRSVGFKLTLRDGTVAYYKPEQTFSAAHWYAEVASYHLDRLLGLGRVPTTVSRAVPWSILRPHARGHRRLHEVVVRDDGTVRGALIAWVPGGLRRIAPGGHWERHLRVDDRLTITPYQRPVAWSRGSTDADGTEGKALRPMSMSLACALSDMILFDYLTTNVDRWGGNFTNVRTTQTGELIFLDNGAGFSLGPTAHIPLMDARLHALQRFQKAIVNRIRKLQLADLRASLLTEPLHPILDERRLDQLQTRRELLLRHVDRMGAIHGHQVWF